MRKLLLLLSILCILIPSASVAADTPGSSVIQNSGITVAPYIQQITLNPSAQSATYNINITNHYSVSVLIHLSVVDFTNLNESGHLRFLTPRQDIVNPYSLKNNIRFQYPEIILGAGMSQVLPVTIYNAGQLAAGGHFAAIQLQIENTSQNSDNNVVIDQASDSLLFVSSVGEGTQNINLATPVLGHIFTSFPTTVNTVFTDSGNTQSVPSGIVQIFNASHILISQTQINTNSNLVLPYAKRLFTINLNQPTAHLWPGYYTLKVTYGNNAQTKFKTYTETFLYISPQVIIFSAAFLVLLFIALVNYKRYVPQTINRAKGIVPKHKTNKKKTPKKTISKKQAGRKIPVKFEDSTHKIR